MSDLSQHPQFLSIDEYNAVERASLAQCSNAEIAAFGPVVFNQQAFPHTVRDEQEIVRYVDTMHDRAADQFFSTDFRISEAELALYNRIRDSVRDLTTTSYGRSVVPILAPLWALKTFRAISEISRMQGNKRLKIVEFGPGSAYLSMLLVLSGHQYICTDITQALYLWQNRIYCQLFGDDFAEMARDGSSFDGLSKPITHIPWWRLRELYDSPVADTDLVIADCAVSEMSQHSLLFNAALSKKLFETGTSAADSFPKLFLFDSFGWKKLRPPETVLADFETIGFSIALHRRLWGLAPKNTPLGEVGLSSDTVLGTSLINKIKRWNWRKTQDKSFPVLALDREMPLYDPDQSGKSVLVRDHFMVEENSDPLDIEFLTAIGSPYPDTLRRMP
jgi:hypothetical protein